MKISNIGFKTLNNFCFKAKPLAFKSSSDFFEKGTTVTGSETKAKIYTSNIDYQAINQIREFCNHPVFRDAPIRIMPDVHAGVNSVVGFSAPVVNGKVIPNIIGGDIGCGMLCVKFKPNASDIDFKKLDDIIKNGVSSKTKKNKLSSKAQNSYLKTVGDLCRYKYSVSSGEIIDSMGTLGGGNHFIEIDKSGDDYYLVIHTGSRKFGKEVARYHSDIAKRQNPYRENVNLSYLSGAEAKDYLADMQLAAEFSKYNRRAIADEIIKRMGWSELESFESIHNYISDKNIIRKGAISAEQSQKVIIPLNMRDGALLAVGKGNSEWNSTAPHGAGRQYKRSVASRHISFDDYKKSMEGIYSTCITPSHIDESPQAYKDPGEIIENISETVDVEDIITPIFNHKD